MLGRVELNLVGNCFSIDIDIFYYFLRIGYVCFFFIGWFMFKNILLIDKVIE